MKPSTVLGAAAAAVLTQASPLGARQARTLATVTMFENYDDSTEGEPAETVPVRAAGTTMFRAEGYAQVCAVMHDRACGAYALVDGKPNIGAGDPAAGANERPLFITPEPPYSYKSCVSLRGETTLPDGSTRTDTWKVRGVRLECPGRAAVAARASAAPASVEHLGNTFFVRYDD